MPKTQVDFQGMHGKPYIQTVHECICNENAGELEFDGYYYVYDENDYLHRRYTDRTLPRIEYMNVNVISDEPPQITYVSSFSNLIQPFSNSYCSVTPINEPSKQLHYDILSNNTYKIEIYRRELIQDTSRSLFIEDGDNEEECTAVFETNTQTNGCVLNSHTSTFSSKTSSSDDLDFGGICLFPTNRQRIYFRILATNPPYDEIAQFMRSPSA